MCKLKGSIYLGVWGPVSTAAPQKPELVALYLYLALQPVELVILGLHICPAASGRLLQPQLYSSKIPACVLKMLMTVDLQKLPSIDCLCR